jgi:hypothetical protein
MGLSYPRTESSLLLSPLLMAREMRGSYNGSNVHHRGQNSNVKSKSTLPDAPNVEFERKEQKQPS